ncbi:protein NPAT isoform A [Alligator mississippiensis]|uniref:Protein NPAT isoform A n=1 Tax=Alligator mississippiensis TaxID=8496 RepID=A0A151P7B9_ALLMI|nr:protein NPAT isoform A [Alligator mississippiensis]
MLLPSDVARLVLGYLQQEKLSATCREFILESSDLKEYAEHCTEDGSVPACLLSLFGKNLTTILNEYVAMKTKETTIEVPAMMSSLWKKLDYTLSQIRSMQNSAGFSAHQRSRTRSGIVDMKRQKMLQQGATPVLGLLSVVPQSGHHNSSTVANTHVIHRPIINQNVTQTRLFASQTQENKISTGDSIHIQVPGPQERKLHSSILSPARRKSDSQKRKSVTSPAPHSQSKNCQESVEMIAEEESEPLQELIDGNFPQLVIENAREKILSNKSLQEKLAENINKFLGSDGSVTQAPKQTDSGLAEQESAIDEILGLQGEIHMSEEAIQDILEQTESDPAFQALFDLFDYGKNKTNKNLPHGVSSQSGVESTVVGEENNLNTLESSLETEEVRDNSTGALSCKDYHPEEAVCTLKNSSSDSGDTGQKSDDSCAEISVVSTESNPAIVETCRSPPGTASSTDEPSTELKRIGGVSSSSQPMDVDPANIMSLKIIISDDPFISSDSELNSAVNSITGENLPTIVLSSPTKSPAKTTGPSKCLTSEEIERSEDSALVEQNLLVLRPKDPVISTVGTKNEDCTVLTVAGTTNIAKDGGFIQLLPTTSTAFGNSNNLYIATCVTDPTVLGTTVTPSNVVVFPGNSMPLAAQAPAAQQLRTPPRSSSTFATSQAMSPNFSQGSAIIIASPVQPVLQGMVGMIPISVVGQNGNTFSAPSHQVLHVPFSNPVCNRSVPKLPIPPKAQKTTGARSKSNIGKPASSTAEPLSHPSSRIQRTGNSDRNVSSDQGRKLEETSLTAVGETTSSNSKQNESHRRVLCFDSALPAPGGNTQAQAMSSSQKEKSENSLFAVDSPSATSASLKIQPSKREKEKTLPRILCKPEISSNRGAVVKEAQPERKALASGVGLESFHKTTANKENELRRDTDDKQNNQEVAKLSNGQQNTGLRNEKTATSVQDVNKKTGTLSNGSSKSSGTVSQSSKEPKQDQAKSSSQGLCLASPLTKQAVEMLHDIQWNSPASKVVENGDLPVPRTPSGVGDRHTDDTTDSIRTPTCRRYNEDSTTPRIMVPPATPDLPACSPTSETGSENSVSMAAHTLMILSRAAIARTSTTTPLKDNTQQFRSLRSTGKKRKLEDLNEGERLSRSASRKDLQSSTTPMKKKKIKKKKLPNSFPAGMDVDKFLLSLHYDE